jgi:intein/homing endonuclease
VPRDSELESAFDAALAEVRKCKTAGMIASDGNSASSYLEQLNDELASERRRAIERGTVDREWFQRTVRWLVQWVPESDLTLIAALGRIARAGPPALS